MSVVAERRFVARRFADQIFPEVAPPDRSRRVLLMLVVGMIVAAVVSVGRYEHSLDSLYAEDGEIFLQRAIDHPTSESVFEPYAGYFHLVPRLVAELASLFSIRSAAVIMSGAGAIGLAIVAAVVFRATRGHIESTVLRLVMAGAFVAIPIGQDEVFNSATNLHWFLMPAMVWMLMARPASRSDAVLFAMVLFVGAASDPLTLILAPLALYRWFALRSTLARLPVVAYAVGLALELAVTVLTGAERDGVGILLNPVKLLVWFLTYTVGALVFGDRFVNDPNSRQSAWLAFLATAALVAVVVMIARSMRRRELIVPFIFAAFGVAFYYAPVILTSMSPPRYCVPPGLLLISALLVLVDRWRRSDRRTPGSTAVVAALGLVMLGASVASYRIDVLRNDSPTWSDGLAAAEQSCAVDGGVVAIEIAPNSDWAVSRRVRRPRRLMAERVAVVAVAYNSADDLPAFLESIPAAGAGLDALELIVVDNASSDDSVAVVGRLAPDAEVVRLPTNRGYAAGINAGIARAHPDADIFVANTDLELAPASLATLVGSLGKGVGITVPRMFNSDGSFFPSLRREPAVRIALGEALLGGFRAGRFGLGEFITSPGEYDHPRSADWACGAAVMVSRACVDATGEWDESFFLYSEESDFILRARDAGHALRYVPDAVVFHEFGEQELRPELWQLTVVNRLRLFARRHGRMHTLAYHLALLANEVPRALTGSVTHRAGLRALTDRNVVRSVLTGREPAPLRRS